jgi:hypothetical protein
VRLIFYLRGQFVVKFLDAVQDVAITEFPLRLDALAENFFSTFVENNAFNLRAAEVNADAKHFLIFRNGGELFKRDFQKNESSRMIFHAGRPE